MSSEILFSFKIYEGGHCHEEIESFLIDYCSERGENIDYIIDARLDQQ